MIKYEYIVVIYLNNGGSITVYDPSVLEQVIAHKDVETFIISDDVMTHYFIPYGYIDSVTITRNSVSVDDSDDAFCTEE